MIDQLTDRLTDLAKAAAIKGAVFAAVGAVLLTGIGFLLAAAYMALAASYGAVIAALTVGGTLVTLGLITLAIMMQRDPGEAVDHVDHGDEARSGKKSEDDVLFDLLVHSAMTGYATGQGNRAKMQTGFDQMIGDLGALGVFDPTGSTKPTAATSQDTDRKMAG